MNLPALDLPPASSGSPPKKTVAVVPCLKSDTDALEKLFSGSMPSQSIERPVSGASSIAIGGWDASGEGYGSLISPLGMQPLMGSGLWGCTRTLNWWEMHNLLEAICKEAQLWHLVGFRVWGLATDNSTAEASFHHKG